MNQTESGSNRRVPPWVLLLLLSLFSLYAELLVIRWLSAEIRIFCYFKNLPLMACLFGLGAGMAIPPERKDLSKWFPVAFLALVSIICFAEPMKLVHIYFNDPTEYYLLGSGIGQWRAAADLAQRLIIILPGLAVLTGVFYLVAFMFFSVGQTLGKLFDSQKPLIAYSINVFASLLGILLFCLVSYLGCPPSVWVAIAVLLSLWFYRKPWQIACLVSTVVLSIATNPPQALWSPYYRVDIVDKTLPADGNRPAVAYGTGILVNHDGIQSAVNNGEEFLKSLTPKQLSATLDYYDLIYDLTAENPEHVLILAAGTGNDVSAALRHGAKHVEGVEIDPQIVELGKKLHPEHPYENPAVHITVDDARAFMRRTNDKYDLINFAYLDSHSAYSSMSSIRLDNYVYTAESFKDAARLLKPNGIVTVTFYATKFWQIARIYNTMKEAFGKEPVGVFSANNTGLTFFIGPPELMKRLKETTKHKLFSKEDAAIGMLVEKTDWNRVGFSTDDWPFLFLRERSINVSYASGLLFCLLIGWQLIHKTFGKLSHENGGMTMFLLGAGFMLVEAKCISQMGLLLGATWLVNSAVVGAILLMILLSNLVVLKFNFKDVRPFYMLLVVSLIISAAIPVSAINTMDIGMRAVLGSLLLCFPMFFAAVIFAVTFSRMAKPSAALGMNLFGCLLGGVLEYASMLVGIAALNYIAAGLYLLAMVNDKAPAGNQSDNTSFGEPATQSS